MNILIHLNTFHWEDHTAQLVELTLNHQRKGDKVFITLCENISKYCPANYKFGFNKCNECIRQQKFILEKILKEVKIIKIDGLENINISNLTSKIKSSENIKKIYYDKHLPAGRLSMSTYISLKQDVFLKYLENRTILDNLLKITIQLYNFAKKIINKHKIHKVYVWNGRRSTDGPFLYAAKKLGIPFYSFINAYNYNYFQVQKTLGVHDLNYTRKEINKLFKLRKKNFIKVSKKFYQFFKFGNYKLYGKTLFSKNFSNKKINFNTNKKKLSIFTSSYWEFASLADKEWSNINIYNFIKKILTDKDISKNYEITIRWHPNHKSATGYEKKEIESLIKNYSKNISHIQPKSDLNSYNLIDESDIILSFGGNIGVEATYYGKPSIIVGTAPYDRLNTVYVVKNLNSLKKLLRHNLKPKEKINSIKYGYFQMMYGNKKFKYLDSGEIGDFYYKNRRLKKISTKVYLKEILKRILLKLNYNFN